jgi:putative ABC transport system permease protein
MPTVLLARYVLANVLRNKRRSALTILSIGFSLFLLIALWTVLNGLLNPPENEVSARRLAVRRSTSLADQMPLAYADKIKRLPHVAMLMPLQWFGGYYREESNQVATLASDPELFFKMLPEIKVSDATRKGFLTDRRGAVIGRLLMQHYGWKPGDTITIKGNIFPVDLELHVVGQYTNPDQENGIYVRWDYVNELMGDTGQIASFWVLTDAKENVAGLCEAIDALFRNTSAETKTETEKAFILGFVSMLGNVRLMIGAIALVVVFTMLLVAASTMAMTIRERMREVAILKALGYSPGHVLGLIVAEGVTIALAGWLTAYGLAVALSHADTNTMTMGFVPKFAPPDWIIGSALGVALAIGLAASILPGLGASRLTVAAAIRRLE